MNRRIFLKLLGVSPIAPSLLCAKEAKKFNTEDYCRFTNPFLSPPDVKWFTLKLSPEIESTPGAVEWVAECEDRLHAAYPDPPDITMTLFDGEEICNSGLIFKWQTLQTGVILY